MAVVTLLSDFVDGSSMALAEDTDAPTLNDYMTGSQGRLWAGVQQRAANGPPPAADRERCISPRMNAPPQR